MESNKELYKQIITFLVITTILSTGIFIWMFLGAKDNMFAVLLMMWTHGISAILTSILLKDKISNYGWKPKNTKILFLSYLLPILVAIVVYSLAWLSGFTEFTSENVMNYRWAKMLGFTLPVPILVGVFSKMIITSCLALIFVTGEEIGWSGFLTPKLLKISSVPVTSIIVGLYWAVWHYPAIIGGFYGNGTPLWIALPGFTLVLIGASFLRTVLVSKSQSLWAGSLVHVSHNVVLMGIFWEMTVQEGYAAYFVSETGILTGFVYVIIAVAFYKFQMRKEGLR